MDRLDRYALVTAMVLCSMAQALAAGPASKWGASEADAAWFKSLKTGNGIPCCDFSDGTRIEDPNYVENPDGSYEVFVGAKWMHVGKEKVISPPDRPKDFNYAIFWGHPESDISYCFMAGSGV